MVIFCDAVQIDDVLTTVGSVETVGTITFNDKAKRLLALMFQLAGSGVKTTAEANIAEWLVQSDDLGLSTYKVASLRNEGGGPATQSGSEPIPLQIIPMGKGPGGMPIKPKNDIVFSIDLLAPDGTEEGAAAAYAVYDDGTSPPDILESWAKGQYLVPSIQSKNASDDEIGDATSEEFDETLTIEGRYSEVVGLIIVQSPDAVPTTAEPFMGHIEITSTVSDITPQKWPIPARGAILIGTLAGRGFSAPATILPIHHKKSRAIDTYTMTAKLLATTSGANAVTVSLLAR